VEIYLVIDKANGSVFNAYDSQEKAINAVSNLSCMNIYYFIEKKVLR
jgi:hypothetical protein